MTRHYETCAPLPAAMITSLRAFGYNLSMAIADLIDNSIYAQAHKIAVDYSWNEGNPWIRILDDGTGMSEKRLREAMRLGSQSPLEMRQETDLGRFGLGLKTACFSQCKLMTVYTKTGAGKAITRSWDLDHVCKCGKWEIGTKLPQGTSSHISILDKQERGTVVLLQKLDRLMPDPVQKTENDGRDFLKIFRNVPHYLEMVFHRFLTGRDKVEITVGRHTCRPWDPFLTPNQFTQPLGIEYLDNRRIEVRPFILPHVSKRTEEETRQGNGLYGWNAHQGFYIYRNKRMIIPGGYLDLPFQPEEHYKLCRIQVDLPNNLDHEWNIDVRKAAASPPVNIRNDLERIAKATRKLAAEIYRARVGRAREVPGTNTKHEVWLKKRRGDKILYQINQEHEVIKRLVEQIHPSPNWVKQLFHLIERAVPHRLIIMDNFEHEDCQVNLPPEIEPPPKELLEMCCQIFKEKLMNGRDPHAAADYACSFFGDHPAYRAAIDKLIEDNRDEPCRRV